MSKAASAFSAAPFSDGVKPKRLMRAGAKGDSETAASGGGDNGSLDKRVGNVERKMEAMGGQLEQILAGITRMEKTKSRE